MTKKIVLKDEKKFKSMKNRALGMSKAIELKVGDIVSWKTWSFDLQTEVFDDKEGLLLEILEENRLENIVLIAKILPFGSSEYEFIPLFSLTKSTKRN
jgi:hypothetical protein